MVATLKSFIFLTAAVSASSDGGIGLSYPKNLIPLQLLVLLHLLEISGIRMVSCNEIDALGFELFYGILFFHFLLLLELDLEKVKRILLRSKDRSFRRI